jgi:serine/threonine-protein kinase
VHRFLREARATARLTSPHAVRVFDVSSLDDGTPYLVMEYLDGTDLASWLQHRGAQSPASAAALVLQACHAIGEAHAQRLVHRDLKPANLFVCDAGHAAPVVKVLDLGSCKFLDEPDELETASTTGLGTPAYMAPEQLRSARRSDLRSDVWSLGVILYELVTGRLPFPGRTVPELRLRTTQDPCPPIHRADTGAYASAAFETTVARCLAKEPAARFQDAGELAAALAPLAGSPTRVSAAPMRSPWRWLSVIVFVVLAIGAALALAR